MGVWVGMDIVRIYGIEYLVAAARFDLGFDLSTAIPVDG